ncbi:Glu/Leu/Phe/Val family dehydrogenase [Ignatzschineria sp. LJL83]
MGLFKETASMGHEKILFAQDEKTNLKAIIAVHSTVLGPALGGMRIWNYQNEEEALNDVIRLSYGMTLKNAAAGLPLGGGKMVVIGDASQLKSEEFFAACARFVNTFHGQYYTAEDVNTTTDDIDAMKRYTDFVVGTSDSSSDPSPYTAKGVLNGIKAAAKVKFGSDSLDGKVVAVQGLGNVGYRLCELLHQEGASLLVYDYDAQKIDRAVTAFAATAVSPAEILTSECDILAPCALGAVITSEIIDQLKCAIIAGSANNILANSEAGDLLDQKGILYTPDYIINAGGVINCGADIVGNHNEEYIWKKIDDIYDTTMQIFALADEKKIPTYQAADQFALGIIENKKSR